jgi:ATP-dependent DNA ligase
MVSKPHGNARFECSRRFAAVCERGLEGIVAKRLRDPYRAGERQWLKTKNRDTARFAEERDGIGRRIEHSRGRRARA